MEENNQIIIYNTADGKASVSLFARDGNVWMNQKQLAELFDTSKQNIGQHIANILKEGELSEDSVVNNYFTTASDGKQYEVTFYALDMIRESAELRAKNQQDLTMDFWRNNVDRILEFQDQAVLDHKGNISKLEMKKWVKVLYEKFDQRRKKIEAKAADVQDIEVLKALEEDIKKKKA